MSKLSAITRQLFNAKLISTLFAVALSSLIIASPQSMAADKSVKKQASVSQQAITRVNINRASIKDLTNLKGIGEKKAIAIVKYRNKNGRFKRVEQLAEVKGIGLSLVETNRALITL